MMEEKPIRLVVSGCCGRMGSLIIEEAAKNPAHFKLVGGLEQEGHPLTGQPIPGFPSLRVSSDLQGALRGADCLIEFSRPEATLAHAEEAASQKVAMLIGTTGLSEEQFVKLCKLSTQIPIFYSANMSLGIVALRRLIRMLSQLLDGFGKKGSLKVSISETHHAQKKDKPSGTAKLLAKEVGHATGHVIPPEAIEAKREGNVVGIHTVTFDLQSERIALQHEAVDRRLFAQGALVMALNFMRVKAKPGWYGMDDFVK